MMASTPASASKEQETSMARYGPSPRRRSPQSRFPIALLILLALSGGSGCQSDRAARTSLGVDEPRDESPIALPLPERSTPAITAADIAAHVRALSDERTEGRLAGTPGERLARDYLVRVMQSIGLEPAGSEGRFDAPFEFTAGIALGTRNRLDLTESTDSEAPLQLDLDWRPLAFSANGEIEPSPIVFAGYGLVAPPHAGEAAIDELAGVDVRDRWVLIFRGLPPDLEGPRRQRLQRYASLRYKAMVARDRGARGVLFVSGPLGRYRFELAPLRFDASLSGTRIAVLSIRDAVAERLFAPLDIGLEEIQERAGRSLFEEHPLDADPTSFEIEGVRLGGRIDLRMLQALGHNVLGRLQVGSEASAETIVLGAHFDHLGHGEGSSSLASGDEVGKIHPGADDNASGVAALLEIAQTLADRRSRGESLGQRDLLFAAWSGEELGLLGSHHWVQTHVDPHSRSEGPVAYLNFDMVGRLRKELVIQGLGSSPRWADLLERATAGLDLSIVRQQDSYLPTDTTSFYTQGIPVLSAFTGIHPEYHTPRDTADRLDPEGTAAIARLFGRIAIALSRDEDPPDYRAQEAPSAGRTRSGFRVFLGTVPDYAQTDVLGVQLSGVAPGGPAETAGVQGGDIIVEVDGTTIENLYDYTYSLEALRVGEPARLVVLRDGKRISLEIIPSSRD